MDGGKKNTPFAEMIPWLLNIAKKGTETERESN